MRFDYHYHPDAIDPRRVQLRTDDGQILDEGVQIKSSEGIELIVYGDNLLKQGETFASYAQILSRDCLVVVPYVFLKSDRKREVIKRGWRDDYILGDIPQRPHSLFLGVGVAYRKSVSARLGLDNVCELFGSDVLLPLPLQRVDCYTEVEFTLPYSLQSFKSALLSGPIAYAGSYYPAWQCLLISVILVLKSRFLRM